MRLFVIVSMLFLLSQCGSPGQSAPNKAYANGDYQTAISEFSKILENRPQDVNALYNRGRSYEEVGKFQEAEADFLKVLDIDAKNVNAMLSLSKLYYQQEAYNKAVITAENALEVNNNSAQGHFQSARAKHQLGYVDGALESYTMAVSIDRNFGDAYLYRGALKIHKKQTRSACDDIRTAMNLGVQEAASIHKKYCN